MNFKHKKKVDTMVKYVNEHNGWTIVGWFRRGEVQDASTEGASADAVKTKLHIALLVPTRDKIRKLRDEEFNKLRIVHGATAVASGDGGDPGTVSAGSGAAPADGTATGGARIAGGRTTRNSVAAAAAATGAGGVTV